MCYALSVFQLTTVHVVSIIALQELMQLTLPDLGEPIYFHMKHNNLPTETPANIIGEMNNANL